MARRSLTDASTDTEELAKIEYLLEALDEAHALGDLPESSYRVLTRRYLDRMRGLDADRDESFDDEDELDDDGESPVDDRDLIATGLPPIVERLVTPPTSRPAYDSWIAPPTPAASRPPREPRPPSRVAAALRDVPWTVWVALAGALLVVAAAAGFAIYAWPTLAVGIRLGILVVVTAAFYGGGLWLRRRLTIVGTSLFAVGAALVLIDGWFLIDAGGLRSLWWWALLLAIGSAVHWGMGVWLRVRLFVVTGALAQVAWWWLLGTALSWPLGARAAILAVVGLVWVLAAPLVRRGAADSIGVLLETAGPLLAAAACIVGIVGVIIDPGWSAVISALVISAAATAAGERQKVVTGAWLNEAAVVTLLPLPVAFLSLPGGPISPAVVLMLIVGVAQLLLSARHGGYLRAASGLFTVLAAPCMPGIIGGGSQGAWIAVVASWLALGTLAIALGSARPGARARMLERGSRQTCQILHWGGWATLLGASMMQVAALGAAEPLMAGRLPSDGALTLLAGEAAAAWLAATAARSRITPPSSEPSIRPAAMLLTAAGLVGYAYSQFAAVLAVHWIDPHAGHAWYSLVTLSLAAAWSHARTLSMRRLFGMSSRVAAWMFGISSITSVLFAIAPALFRSSTPRLGIVLLAALAVLVWLLEVWRFGERVFAATASPALAVAVYLAAWKLGGRGSAGMATVVATLITLPLPGLLEHLRLPRVLQTGDARARATWTAPSLAAGLMASAALMSRPVIVSACLLALAVATVAAHLVERPWHETRSKPDVWTDWPADAGLVCVVLAMVGALVPVARQLGALELGLAWAVAIVGSLAFEVWGRIRPRRIAVEFALVAFTPLVLWAIGATVTHASAWKGAAAVVTSAVVLLFTWRRGGHSRAVGGSAMLLSGLVLLVVSAFGVERTFNEITVTAGIGLFLGFALLTVSLLIRATTGDDARRWGTHDLRRVFCVEGWVLLTASTAMAVTVTEFGQAHWRWGDRPSRPVSPTALSCFALLIWITGAAARWAVESRREARRESQFTMVRDTAPVIVTYALSLYVAAILERWTRTQVPMTWIVAAIFTASLAWSRLRQPMRRLLGCRVVVIELMWAATSGVLALVILFAAATGRHAPDPSAGIILAICGVAWCAETARFGRVHFMPPASAALAAAAGLTTWSLATGAAGGLAAAVAGAVLALAPLLSSRTIIWRLVWSLGAAIATLVGVVGASSAVWSATLALAALSAALAGVALAGLPVFAGASAFVAFAAICSLEHWIGAEAWTGTVVAVVAAAAMLLPTAARRTRPRPSGGAEWSLAVAGALALVGMMVATMIASAIGGVLVAPVSWLSGGAWSVTALLLALGAYCALWSLCDRTRWGLFTGYGLLLAGLLVLLGAAGVDTPEAYLTVVTVWCVAAAWMLTRSGRHRRVVVALDIVALVAGLLVPALLMVFSGFGRHSASHAIWLICLATAMVGVGIGLRVRLYFGCGLGGVVLAALWLTSSQLSAIPAVVAIVALVGGALITLGAVGERRRKSFAQAAKQAFAGWR